MLSYFNTYLFVYLHVHVLMSCLRGIRDGAVVRALSSHQCRPDLIPGLGICHMWVEFVVGSHPFSDRFFPE